MICRTCNGDKEPEEFRAYTTHSGYPSIRRDCLTCESIKAGERAMWRPLKKQA